MTDILTEEGKEGRIMIEQERFIYRGLLPKRFTAGALSHLKELLDGVHPEEKIIFNYNGTSYTREEIIRLEGKRGQLELTVVACKANDWVTQSHNNEDAGMCFGAILEYLGLRLPSEIKG